MEWRTVTTSTPPTRPASHVRLNLKEAAIYLGISAAKLKADLHRDAGPPHYRLGRRIIFDSRDLDSWLAQHRVEPKARDAA
jgi:predicted DNA-binding transcriptional regulator AlpA